MPLTEQLQRRMARGLRAGATGYWPPCPPGTPANVAPTKDPHERLLKLLLLLGDHE